MHVCVSGGVCIYIERDICIKSACVCILLCSAINCMG